MLVSISVYDVLCYHAHCTVGLGQAWPRKHRAAIRSVDRINACTLLDTTFGHSSDRAHRETERSASSGGT